MKTINAEDFGAYADQLVNVLTKAPVPDAMKKVHEIGCEETTKAFVTKASPQGESWPARKVVGDGHPLMVLSGSLAQAATGGAGHALVLADRSVGYGVDLDAPRIGLPQTPWKHKTVDKKLKADQTLTYTRALALGYPENNLPPRDFQGMGEDAVDKSGKVIMDDLCKQLVAIP